MAPVQWNLQDFVRPNIWKLVPYRCARDDYDKGILLDANENSFGPPFEADGELHRYPCPYQLALKQEIANFRGVKRDQIFLGVGSDEAIDLVIRIFCTPGRDSIMITSPTYGMYKVAANTNDVGIQDVPLDPSFNLRTKEMLEAVNESTRVIFLCSPNNPTGNLLKEADVRKILDSYRTGVVIVDEAYIDFSGQAGASTMLNEYPHLIVLQTFSKAWGLAGIRLGMAIANENIVEIMNRVKAPYNISKLTSKMGLEAMRNISGMKAHVQGLLDERTRLVAELKRLLGEENVLPTDANFFLFRINNAYQVYKKMADDGVVSRYRGDQIHCKDCIRLTVGTKEENDAFLELLKKTAGL
eukprot:Colp12_sorted_trinity150504_noHs@1715